MITGLHHVNILVPEGPQNLAAAESFYAKTLGLTTRAVPHLQTGQLAWFDIGESGQQVHVAFGRDFDFSTTEARTAARHPCFKIESAEKLLELQMRIWTHFKEGGLGAPMECDEPGGESSGAKGVEYPSRFFARDFAGNRLEFSL